MIQRNTTTHTTRTNEFKVFDILVECLDTGNQFTVRTGLYMDPEAPCGHGAVIKVGFWLDNHLNEAGRYRTLGHSQVPDEHQITRRSCRNSFDTHIVTPSQ